MFTSLSDRLTATFKNLRGKGRLSESDVNKTVRDIRMALIDADVALPVVKEFTSAVRERATGAEVSSALNPAQQVIKIVNEELVGILGGNTRTIQLAKRPPTVIMLAGLQGSGKTTFAGKLGPTPSPSSRSPVSAPGCRSSRRSGATAVATTPSSSRGREPAPSGIPSP